MVQHLYMKKVNDMKTPLGEPLEDFDFCCCCLCAFCLERFLIQLRVSHTEPLFSISMMFLMLYYLAGSANLLLILYTDCRAVLCFNEPTFFMVRSSSGCSCTDIWHNFLIDIWHNFIDITQVCGESWNETARLRIIMLLS